MKEAKYNHYRLMTKDSNGFGTKGISNAPSYWTSDLEWHEGKFNPQGWMVQEMINSIEESK